MTEKEKVNEHYYMFRNLESEKNYSISLAARNEYGLGPATSRFVVTLPTTMSKYNNLI